jgi:hypothetical protein
MYSIIAPRDRVVNNTSTACAHLGERGYCDSMTSDLEATTDDLYATIRDLHEAQQGDVPDTAIAEASGLELTAVRDFLDNADGVKLVVGRDGETRTVTELLD